MTFLIVIDSSAIIAIIQAEPEADAFAQILQAQRSVISAANVFEAEVVVLRRLGHERVMEVRLLLEQARTTILPFDDEQARTATAAYRQFGKGRHPARLNLNDCAAYALARSLDLPLLYKGDDFSQTDIRSAVTSG